MIITTQLTKDYYDKAQPLFESIARHWEYRFIPGFIDFTPEYYGEHYLMRSKDIHTFSDHYPSNRDFFVCPQGGEFIDYIDCEDDDIIIQIDADTIMQRNIMPDELLDMMPKPNEMIVVNGANPAPSLYQVTKNLKFKNPELFSDMKDINEFTASFIVARADTFMNLRDYVIQFWDWMTYHNDHHAGIQWLISMIGNYFFQVKIIDNVYQCGDWYKDFNTEVIDKKLYFNDKLVIFNHTKFNEQWNRQ